MAGIASVPGSSGASPAFSSVSSMRHFQTIAWLRWRIFRNTLRGKGAVGELVVNILSYPLLALIILGPSVGSGFAAWYFVSQGMVAYLAIPLWIIFFLWQFIGVSTSATGPNFDVAALIRFPIRYRDYLLIRLSFGLLDPPTLAGICCLVATTIGVTVASPMLFPWAALALFIYAACNVLFSRMLYSWLERWLAQRRTRELFTVLILVASLAFQFVGQLAGRLGHHGQHMSPWMKQLSHTLLTINWFLPPGLTASAIDHMHRGVPLIALASLGGLLLYTTAFLLLLNARLRAEFHGENLSEAPAAATAKTLAKDRMARAAELAAARSAAGNTGVLASWLSPAVLACLVKEVRYLTRSGPKLYALIMPVFMIVLISMRTSGFSQAGLGQGSEFQRYLFSSGCAYTLMILVGFIYNALGADGPGIQFYFMSPIRFRDVMLAKNLMTGCIFLIEIILIYIASTSLGAQTPLSLICATVAWCLFAFFLNVSIGNVRSILSPKAYEAGKVRKQNVSGLNSLISVVLIAVISALGSGVLFACRMLHIGFWPAAGVFLVLAGIAFAAYVISLKSIDRLACGHMEELTVALVKR